MRACGYGLSGGWLALLASLLAIGLLQKCAMAELPGQSIVPSLQEQLGLSERQALGALGALLVFVREHCQNRILTSWLAPFPMRNASWRKRSHKAS
jgi:hypothetical protein